MFRRHVFMLRCKRRYTIKGTVNSYFTNKQYQAVSSHERTETPTFYLKFLYIGRFSSITQNRITGLVKRCAGCAGCNACYVDETTQLFSTRVSEHLITNKNSHNQNYNKNVRWQKNSKKNMSFRLSIYSLRRIKTGMQNDKIYARKGEIKIRRRTKEPSYIAQLNSLVHRKGKIPKSTTSLMLYEPTTIPPMLIPTS